MEALYKSELLLLFTDFKLKLEKCGQLLWLSQPHRRISFHTLSFLLILVQAQWSNGIWPLKARLRKCFSVWQRKFGNWPAQLHWFWCKALSKLNLLIIKYFPFAPSVSTFIGNLGSSERKVQSKSMYSFSNSQGLPRGKGQIETDEAHGLCLPTPVQEKSFIAQRFVLWTQA